LFDRPKPTVSCNANGRRRRRRRRRRRMIGYIKMEKYMCVYMSYIRHNSTKDYIFYSSSSKKPL